MKKFGLVNKMKRGGLFFFTAIGLLVVLVSCRKDNQDIQIEMPELTVPEHDGMVLLMYNNKESGLYRVYQAGSELGELVCTGSGIGSWLNVTAVRSGVNQFLVCHPNKEWSGLLGKQFSVRRIESDGCVGEETNNQTWSNNYSTFFGFQLGDRGFVFGEATSAVSFGHWFTQEIYADGTLAPDEAASGDWNNAYEYATPLYVNGQTYLFFQNDKTQYWFITHVQEDGSLNDVCDGHWGKNWQVLTSVEIEDNTYMIGETNDGNEWFIQRINLNGSMGEETARSTWNHFYNCQVAYTLDEQAYLFGCHGSDGFDSYFFTQFLTSDGKMGSEISNGWIDPPDKVIPFKLYTKPDSFRYVIGWNMSKTNGKPASWSSRHDGAWGGYFKMGGGAALANIDGDPGQMLDALLMGIEDQNGGDRFYYKIAWNLDIFGNPSSMSNTMFGPSIGWSQAGAGADMIDVDQNGVADMIFMVIDDPEGANSFWYYIGYNPNSQGIPTHWSDKIQHGGTGDYDQGGGAAAGLIDNNNLPDLVFITIDNPQQDNNIRMLIGKNLDANGLAQSWTPYIQLPCDIGWESAGAGAALADINKNGRLDLVLMNIDSPKGPNNLWSWVGWDIDINGNVSGWSAIGSPPSPGNITSGGGAAIGDIDLNGTPDLFLMTVDNTYGND